MYDEKRELLIYLVSVFAITFLTGIPLAYSYYNGLSVDVFPLVQMLYPAACVMLTYMIVRKGDPMIPQKRYTFYLGVVSLAIIAMIMGTVLKLNVNGLIESALVIIGFIFIFLILKVEDKEKAREYGLRGSMKGWIKYSLIFILFYIASLFLEEFFSGNISEMMQVLSTDTFKKVFSMILLPITFLFQIMIFFGEEYGWRYFLQGRLQNMAGKRVGVILTGIIWGLWHMPLNFFYYMDPEYGLIGMASYQIGCITGGIFLAYVFMKTKNIWVVSIIHCINNMMTPIIYGMNSTSSRNPSWGGVVASLVANVLVFGIILFAKEFRKEQNI